MENSWIRFDRNELAGAFGDLGTDLPLLAGVILTAKMDSASVLFMFGAMQILSGLRYGLPMPVQPLKAIAALVIASGGDIRADIVLGAGLAIGLIMLVFTFSGLLEWLVRVVPKCVVRGIQLGLGLKLATLALIKFVPTDGMPGYVLAGIAFAVTVTLLGNRRFPPALIVIGLGLLYAVVTRPNFISMTEAFGFHVPQFTTPQPADIWEGILLLALAQIPLSIGNSILATRQTAEDLFPERKLTVRSIGLTYSLMNLINPFFGAFPTCHGSGGLAGHYTFGARTGGSVVIYGSFYVLTGLFLSAGFSTAINVFPKPVLGVLLFFEGFALIRLMRDLLPVRLELLLAGLVGTMAIGLPYGYAVGLVIGTVLAHLLLRHQTRVTTTR